jgi:hypothetical protein
MASATVSMISAFASIPVLVASASMSLAIASICFRTSSGDSSSTSFTPSVFWAVTAVMAVMP